MAKSALNPLIDTPCVGICSTVYGDVVCRGCKRFFKEIIEWNGYEHASKQEVYQRLSQLMSETMESLLSITDPVLLQQHLEKIMYAFMLQTTLSAGGSSFITCKCRKNSRCGGTWDCY